MKALLGALLHRLVRPGEVVLTWCDDADDPQYDISRSAYEALQAARDSRGRRLKIHRLPQPGPLYMTAEEAAGVDDAPGTRPRRAGDRLAASYVNFYIANRQVVMPLLDPRRRHFRPEMWNRVIHCLPH